MPRSREVINERFTIEQLAGFGGMGQVYRARDRVSGGLVALKVMHDAEKLEIERFAREAQVLATLSHPGIVRYIDSGITAEGEPYLAMEWLSGETLAARLQRTQLTLAEAFALGRRVASALDAIHRRGVVHRDIKPSNLFLRGGAIDKVALIDFGMARRPLADPKLTVTGTMLGTPGYIAPEQVYNVPNLDGRADIFSLGCVLYRCLSGRAPFRGPDALRMLLNGTPAMLPRLREHRPSIPHELDDLVARMLSRSPEDRPPAGDVVAAELLVIEEKEPSPPAAGSGPRRVVSEIMATERRLMCLILARLVVRTAPARPAAEREAQERALYEVVERHRGKLEILADGSLLVILSNADAATDLAARAARAALALQGLLGSGSVVVVSGREVLGPGLHASELLDRAVDLLETTAKRETVSIDELTSALLKNRFDTGRTGRHLRGELREHNPTRLVFGDPVPCVGREQELDQLETIFDQCAEERVAGMVLLSGADGVGKSCLGHEFLGRLEARGRAVEIWLGEADALHAGSAFGLLGRVLRRALRLVDDEPIEVRRDKIRAWSLRHPGAGGRRFTEILGALVGTPFPTDENPELGPGRHDPRLPSEEMGQAFRSFLRAACEAQPVVIVLEDLHWGDLPTIKLIYAALGVLSDQPLLVLALARTNIHELIPQLWADRCVQEIRLGKLSRRASAQLVRQALGGAVAEDTLKALVKRSDRHAAYLGELIRAAAEGTGAATPQAVLAMVQARIEKLDPAARRVLRAASIFGETFWRGGVEALLGDGDTAAWLAVLAEQGVVEIRDDGRFPAEVEYHFQHALVREAAYEMLTTDDRVTGNWLAGRWLEQVGETDAKIIEAHYERCENGGTSAPARGVQGGDGDSDGRRREAWLERGELLGDRFELEERVGSGGVGQLLRARDRVSGDLVAVKLLSDGRDHHTARFELVSELSHPGIVRYLSHGATPSGQRFLVMEWLDGEDLGARLAHAPLTMSEVVTLAIRVAEALGAAHARGIVHSDLKPSNLFLPGGRIDQVKVLDFGIAHKAGRTQLPQALPQARTQARTMIRTPGYLAPEQARSRGVVDARADVFALGCVVFQCLTGTPAFEGGTTTAILGKILFGEVPRVSALWSEVPEDLDALVARMLAKDPALRPADGANLAAALAALEPLGRSAAVAPNGRTGKHLALTGGECRFLSVVLLGGSSEDDAAEEALRQAITPYGGRAEQLADGSTIVMREVDRQVATDHAAQAARCALAMRALAGGRPMAIAMGRAETTRKLPEEDVIDRAARLLAHMATPSDQLPPIALDEVSAGLLDARFEVSDSKADLMLHGERALLQGARTLLGRPTSCVGRDWELGALTGVLDACIDEAKPRAVVMTAAAGIGKSRVGAELVSRVQQRAEHVAIWVGRGDSLRAGSTLDLLAQALRGALGIHGGEPLAERQNKLRARVAERVPPGDHKRVTEFLGELVGAPFPDDGDGGAQLKAARQDAQLMTEQMRKVWLDFLDAETSVHPVLILLEDLHWGDLGTVRFIDAALRDRRERPWMVLALARPEVYEVFPRLWAEHQNVQELRLGELGRKAAERLVRQVLGDSVGTDTVERLVQQADGNAFYLEELIRAAAEGKAKDHALPETVLAMVEARLGRLAVEARRVLRAASVFGEVCWEGSVAALLGGAMGATTVGEWLAKLIEQEVLAVRPDSRFPGQRELMFRHSLLREGAYATLTGDDGRLGHRLAGDWLEHHGEGDPLVLAGHFEAGGDGARAASYYLRAAEQALHVLDLDATIAHAGLGLGCSPPQELRLALLGIRCEASAHGWQRVSIAMPDAEELVRSAPRGSIPWSQAMNVYFEGTMVAGRISDLLAAVALLREVDAAPEAVGKMALTLLGGTCIFDAFGRIVEGTGLEERCFAIVGSIADRASIARFWWNILIGMRASYAHEDPWKGLEHSDAIRAIFEVIGGESMFLNMQLFRGLNRWYLGAGAAAEQILGEIAAADEALGVASPLRRFGLSWLRADRGALDDARALASQLTDHGHAHHNPLEEGRGRWVLAEVLRRMGDLDAADRELAVALAMAVPLEQPGVLGSLSALRLAQDRAGEALVAAEDAVARCATMGGCGMFRGAFVRLVHAEALHATGAHDAARRAIAEARARLFAIAGRIADPGYRTSFLDTVPENARTLALARAWLDDGSERHARADPADPTGEP